MAVNITLEFDVMGLTMSGARTNPSIVVWKTGFSCLENGIFFLENGGFLFGKRDFLVWKETDCGDVGFVCFANIRACSATNIIFIQIKYSDVLSTAPVNMYSPPRCARGQTHKIISLFKLKSSTFCFYFCL